MRSILSTLYIQSTAWLLLGNVNTVELALRLNFVQRRTTQKGTHVAVLWFNVNIKKYQLTDNNIKNGATLSASVVLWIPV